LVVRVASRREGHRVNTDSEILEWRGRAGPSAIKVNDSVFRPTHTSRTLADALEVNEGEAVIDCGCGSGVLAFVAARLGAGHVIGCDISRAAVEQARENAEILGLEDRTEFRAGSLLEPVRGERADVLIGDVSGVADDIGRISGWFPDGIAGGPTGAELPMKMLEEIGDILRPGGRLYLPTGTIQNESRILDVARRVFGTANMEKVMEREFPLPDVVAKSKEVARLVGQGFVSLRTRGSRALWRLSVWRCVREG
jgi:methylase of polypeptide subunit release factors